MDELRWRVSHAWPLRSGQIERLGRDSFVAWPSVHIIGRHSCCRSHDAVADVGLASCPLPFRQSGRDRTGHGGTYTTTGGTRGAGGSHSSSSHDGGADNGSSRAPFAQRAGDTPKTGTHHASQDYRATGAQAGGAPSEALTTAETHTGQEASCGDRE